MESDLFVNIPKKKQKKSHPFVCSQMRFPSFKTGKLWLFFVQFYNSCIVPPPPAPHRGGEAPFIKNEDLLRRHESVVEVSKASKLRSAG